MSNFSSDLIGQRNLRLEKVKTLKKLGVDPYPAKSYKEFNNAEIVNDFEKFNGKMVTVAGRIENIRSHGKLVFIDLVDDSGKIQVYIKDDEIEPADFKNAEYQTLGFEEINLLDSADFIEVKGEVTKTQRGEISILTRKLRLLTKTIRPIPTSLEDKEERFRRRYVDMQVHTEVRDRMKRRALFWQAHREFLNSRGFYEVNIPILEHVPGGGDAVPFTTHMNAINEDFFLRISHELPLKRLVGAGFEKVYDIGARFRNEGLSDEHLPEHVAMEFYWAYADWKDGMKFIQELYKFIIERVYNGQTKFKIREFEVDFGKEWDILDFNKIFQERYGVKDIYEITLDEVKDLLQKNNIAFDRTVNIARGVDALWKKIRKTVTGPAFLINHPKYLSPLQKPSLENPNMVERFQPIIAGSELGNGWSEVNDPVDQYDRFLEQQKLRDAGDAEAQWLDIDFVEMLEYGMAPTFGYGHSERVFWFLEDVTAREGVPFPQLKFEVDNLTQQIYPEAMQYVMHASADSLQSTADSSEPTAHSSEPAALDLASVPELDLVSIDEDVKSKFPGIKTGYVVLENVKVQKNNKDLEELKSDINKIVQSKYASTSDIKKSANIEGFREIYKGFGVDPNSHLNSSESLLRRVVSGKGLYNINTVVDTYNVTSVEFEAPMAAYDLNQVQGKISLRFAKDGDQITKILETEPTSVESGSLVYSDDKGVTCMDFNYRDSDRTKITENANKIIVFVDGHEGISQQEVEKILGIVSSRLEKFTGGKVIGKGYVA